MLTNITGLRLKTAAMMVEKSPIRLNSQLIHKSINKSIYKLKILKIKKLADDQHGYTDRTYERHGYIDRT